MVDVQNMLDVTQDSFNDWEKLYNKISNMTGKDYDGFISKLEGNKSDAVKWLLTTILDIVQSKDLLNKPQLTINELKIMNIFFMTSSLDSGWVDRWDNFKRGFKEYSPLWLLSWSNWSKTIWVSTLQTDDAERFSKQGFKNYIQEQKAKEHTNKIVTLEETPLEKILRIKNNMSRKDWEKEITIWKDGNLPTRLDQVTDSAYIPLNVTKDMSYTPELRNKDMYQSVLFEKIKLHIMSLSNDLSLQFLDKYNKKIDDKYSVRYTVSNFDRKIIEEIQDALVIKSSGMELKDRKELFAIMTWRKHESEKNIILKSDIILNAFTKRSEGIDDNVKNFAKAEQVLIETFRSKEWPMRKREWIDPIFENKENMNLFVKSIDPNVQIKGINLSKLWDKEYQSILSVDQKLMISTLYEYIKENGNITAQYNYNEIGYEIKSDRKKPITINLDQTKLALAQMNAKRRLMIHMAGELASTWSSEEKQLGDRCIDFEWEGSQWLFWSIQDKLNPSDENYDAKKRTIGKYSAVAAWIALVMYTAWSTTWIVASALICTTGETLAEWNLDQTKTIAKSFLLNLGLWVWFGKIIAPTSKMLWWLFRDTTATIWEKGVVAIWNSLRKLVKPWMVDEIIEAGTNTATNSPNIFKHLIKEELHTVGEQLAHHEMVAYGSWQESDEHPVEKASIILTQPINPNWPSNLWYPDKVYAQAIFLTTFLPHTKEWVDPNQEEIILRCFNQLLTDKMIQNTDTFRLVSEYKLQYLSQHWKV